MIKTARPYKYPVLLLTSYCGEQTEQCNDLKPCIECLAMCNVFGVQEEDIKSDMFIGTLDYLTEVKP